MHETQEQKIRPQETTRAVIMHVVHTGPWYTARKRI